MFCGVALLLRRVMSSHLIKTLESMASCVPQSAWRRITRAPREPPVTSPPPSRPATAPFTLLRPLVSPPLVVSCRRAASLSPRPAASCLSSERPAAYLHYKASQTCPEAFRRQGKRHRPIRHMFSVPRRCAMTICAGRGLSVCVQPRFSQYSAHPSSTER